MPITNAIRFFNDLTDKKELRSYLYRCETQTDLFKILAENGYEFTLYEIEEAINISTLKKTTQESSEHLKEKFKWFVYLYHSLEPK